MAQTRNHSILLAAAVALAAHPVGAQVAYDSPAGRVEILGLQRWTLKMLRDSVRSRSQGLELHDAACMVVLRESLGFPDALVYERRYQAAPGGPVQSYHVIKLVEPQARHRVQWLNAQRDSFTVLRPQYAPVVLAASDSNGVLWVDRLLWPLRFYGQGPQARAARLAGAPPALRADAERLWAFLDARKKEVDWQSARRVLREDGAFADRLIAAAILANFPERDSTWWALTDALRDPHESVRRAAQAVLQEFPSREIDWAAQIETLRFLIGGTNVAATEDVFTMLARTRVVPSLARPLLRGNEFWVLTHLRARDPGTAAAARGLLIQLHGGKDLGPSYAAWAAWIRQL